MGNTGLEKFFGDALRKHKCAEVEQVEGYRMLPRNLLAAQPDSRNDRVGMMFTLHPSPFKQPVALLLVKTRIADKAASCFVNICPGLIERQRQPSHSRCQVRRRYILVGYLYSKLMQLFASSFWL